MMWPVQLTALYWALLAFALHDLYDQTIPRWLCALVAGGFTLLHFSLGLEWWWASAILSATCFTLAGLPMGDRAAIFLACGLLPPWEALAVTLAALGVGWLYVGVQALSGPQWMALTATVALTAGLRLLALQQDWRLPEWRVDR